MSAASFDPRIRAYYGDAMLRAGFVPLPHLFLRHYRKLGLSHLQALFVLQLIEIVWDLGDAPTSVARLAERLGVDRRTVQICAKELQDLGLVEVFDRWDETGAQIENGYDLSGLFQRITTIDQQPATRTMVRRSRQGVGSTQAAGGSGQGVGSMQSAGPQPPTPTPQPPTPNPQPPTPNTQPPTPQRSMDQGGERSVDRTGVDARIAPPVMPGSGLNTGKKKTKITQKQGKKHQQRTSDATTERAGVVVVAAQPSEEQRAVSASEGGHSSRWNVALSPAEVALSRSILQRCGVHGAVAGGVAATLHPAEAWALRLYARAARLTPAWIARQVYDWGTKRPRIADLSAHDDDAGRAFAALDLAVAERLCDVLDAACPKEAASLARTVETTLGDDPAIVAATRIGWALMAQQRGGPPLARAAVAPPAPQEQTTTSSSLWQRVQQRLKHSVPPDDYSTWLHSAVLLDHAGDLVVIGTPNVFVRDKVDTIYRAAVEDVLRAELGHAVELDVVIGSTPLVPD